MQKIAGKLETHRINTRFPAKSKLPMLNLLRAIVYKFIYDLGMSD